MLNGNQKVNAVAWEALLRPVGIIIPPMSEAVKLRRIPQGLP